jgi:hypothetical protein
LKWPVAAALIFSLLSLHAENRTYFFTSKRTQVSFPFRLFNNIIVVDLRLNDSKTLKFIFDSGCKSTIVIHPKWLDSFDIPYHQKVYFSGLGYKDSVETMKIDNGTLQIGELRGEHVPLFILSKDSLIIDNYLGTDVDGIFGAEIFERFCVHINYRKRLVEIFEKPPAKKISRMQKIPIQVRKSKGYLSCSVVNESRQFFLSEFLLDTGANVPVIIKNKEPSDLKITSFVDAEIGEGLSGPVYSKVCRIKSLWIDTIQLQSVVGIFNETPITFKEVNENMLDGNIGNDILNRFDIYYAYPQRAIYLRPNGTLRDPFYFNISNIILLENKSRNGGFIVKNIAGNSPPLIAGLRKGDEIIKIDTYDCSDLNLEDALALLNKRIGRKITLKYMRGNVVSKISYKLASII